jgi:hypothetical protein
VALGRYEYSIIFLAGYPVLQCPQGLEKGSYPRNFMMNDACDC